MKSNFIANIVIFFVFRVFVQAQETPIGYQDTIVCYFTGDVTLAEHFEREIGDSVSNPFSKMKWFGEADITMVNLENAVTTGGSPVLKEFNFRALPKYCSMLRDAGIDVVSLANNHSYDYGDEGLFDTMDHLSKSGIRYVGAGLQSDSAIKPLIQNVKGVRIGFLAYLDSIGTPRLFAATPSGGGVSVLVTDSMTRDIGLLKQQCDFIIVNMHWGREKSHITQLRQIAIAHKAIDAGADLIVGHHPHVLQGIERYRGKIIAYSLGNFIFGGHSRSSYSTAVLKVSIPRTTLYQYSAEVIPIAVYKYRAERAEGAAADTVLEEVRRYSKGFRDDIFRIINNR